MTRYARAITMCLSAAGLAAIFGGGLAAQQGPATTRVIHTDTSRYRPQAGVHAGAGSMSFGALLNGGALGPHFNFMHRGEIPPGAGIGHHFHNMADEMFVILNGEAQFTIDGRTALVKGPAAVVCRAGHSHAIYNSSTETLQWINFQVGVVPGVSDAFDLGDDRSTGVTLDRVPTFMVGNLDPALVRAGGRGRGGPAPAPAAPAAPTVMSRRVLGPTVFASAWAYVDQVIVPPGVSSPEMPHPSIAEAYYVLAGSGTVAVGGETTPIKKWDAVPVRLNETSAFKNTGTEPLELLVYGVAKDMDAKMAIMAPAGRGRQ